MWRKSQIFFKQMLGPQLHNSRYVFFPASVQFFFARCNINVPGRMIVPDEIFVPGNIIMPDRTPDSIHKYIFFLCQIGNISHKPFFCQIELEELFTVFGNLGVEVRQKTFGTKKIKHF